LFGEKNCFLDEIISASMRCAGYVTRKRVVVGKPEGKRPYGRPRHRLEDNIKMDLQVASGAWTGLIWLRIGTGGVHFNCGNESSGFVKYWKFHD